MSLESGPVFFHSRLFLKVVGILYVQQFFEQHAMPEGEALIKFSVKSDVFD